MLIGSCFINFVHNRYLGRHFDLLSLSSFRMAVQRLSWRDPKNFLFLCRVRNVSSRCLQVCGLGALWLSCTQRGREGKQELGDGELDPPLIQVTCDALRGGRGEASSPTILPLVPYRELAAKANCADTPSATPNVLDPNDELLLVFSAQEPDKLKRVVEAGGYAQLVLLHGSHP